jgi:hypothetical protein
MLPVICTPGEIQIASTLRRQGQHQRPRGSECDTRTAKKYMATPDKITKKLSGFSMTELVLIG